MIQPTDMNQLELPFQSITIFIAISLIRIRSRGFNLAVSVEMSMNSMNSFIVELWNTSQMFKIENLIFYQFEFFFLWSFSASNGLNFS